jgi:hypothetical protein
MQHEKFVKVTKKGLVLRDKTANAMLTVIALSEYIFHARSPFYRVLLSLLLTFIHAQPFEQRRSWIVAKIGASLLRGFCAQVSLQVKRIACDLLSFDAAVSRCRVLQRWTFQPTSIDGYMWLALTAFALPMYKLVLRFHIIVFL